MDEQTFASFEEFWDFYVKAHSDPINRALHFVGTTAALGCVAGFLTTGNPLLLPTALLVGYGPAWVGHFFFEKNRPASWKYPVWSFRADFVMYARMWRGQMQAEVDRVLSAAPSPPVAGPRPRPAATA